MTSIINKRLQFYFDTTSAHPYFDILNLLENVCHWIRQDSQNQQFQLMKSPLQFCFCIYQYYCEWGIHKLLLPNIHFTQSVMSSFIIHTFFSQILFLIFRNGPSIHNWKCSGINKIKKKNNRHFQRMQLWA